MIRAPDHGVSGMIRGGMEAEVGTPRFFECEVTQCFLYSAVTVAVWFECERPANVLPVGRKHGVFHSHQQ